MNYHELLWKAKQILKAKGKEEADARYLLFFLMKWSSTDYLRHAAEKISAETEQAYSELLNRRLAGVPVQQIIGNQIFYGYEIEISKEVLTPRPETEQLVDLALSELKGKKRPKVMDLCTGSGCIAIAVAAENRQARVVGVDVSKEALYLAKKNAERHGLEDIQWIESNLFEMLDSEKNGLEKFDMIISNPPYIPSEEIENLEIEVRHYDPVLALDGGEDGLDFYRKISEKGQQYLVENGKLLLEIGHGQSKAICRILETDGWKDCKEFEDYAGRERIIMATKGSQRDILGSSF